MTIFGFVKAFIACVSTGVVNGLPPKSSFPNNERPLNNWELIDDSWFELMESFIKPLLLANDFESNATILLECKYKEVRDVSDENVWLSKYTKLLLCRAPDLFNFVKLLNVL